MNKSWQIHVVDVDYRRRQTVVRIALNAGLRAEPYESVDELIARTPSSGLLLAEARSSTMADSMSALEREGAWLATIGYCENPKPSEIVQAVLDGAAGFLPFPFGEAELGEALAIAQQIVPWSMTLGRGLAVEADPTPSASRLIATLTPREMQVLSQAMDGLTNVEIGSLLQISPRTVEIHRANMMRKLRARRFADAMRIAIEAQLLDSRSSRPVAWSGGQRTHQSTIAA